MNDKVDIDVSLYIESVEKYINWALDKSTNINEHAYLLPLVNLIEKKIVFSNTSI